MNKKYALLAIIPAMLLSSCSFFKFYDSEEKQVGVYVLDTISKKENSQLNDAYIGDLTIRYKNGEKYIPYISLRQYASIYSRFLEKGAVSEVSTEGFITSWKIEMNNELYFYAAISPLEKLILKAGDITNVLKSGEGGIQPSYDVLNYGVHTDTSYDHLSEENYATYTFADCDFDCFRSGQDVYMPLGLLDLAFCESSGLYVTYNYRNIYCSTNVDDFSQLNFKDGFSYSTVDDQMARATNGFAMPQYLINYNADCFLFVMQNFYGLRSHFGIKNMKQFYQASGLYDKFRSGVSSTRGLAFSEAINMFDDNHSAIISVNQAWGETARAPYGPGIRARSALEKRLSQLRKEKWQGTDLDYEPAEGDIRYSQDGKTAMFFFDSFKYGAAEEVFDNLGFAKSTAYKYDTFFLFRKTLNEIAGRSSVENVIIDISLNGGGTLGVMMKLLPFLTKNNKSNAYFYDDADKVAFTYSSRSDVNGDGEYTDNEAYGNRFNFYILTSDCSFSCGNAFPCLAQEMGIKIIGETSGGGECAVSIHYLPNSQYIYHSSNLHLGSYNSETKTFRGFEDGATPDIPLTENNKPMCTIEGTNDPEFHIPAGFYDVDVLGERIAQNNN